MKTATTLPATSLSLVAPSANSPFDRDAPTARMYLSSRTKSAVAVSTITGLANDITDLRGNRKTASAEYHLALGAMVAELARAASHSPPLGCYRPLRASDFPSGGIGYRPFNRALNDMIRHGYVTTGGGESAWRERLGSVTRIYVTPKLTDYLSVHGITVADREKHFQYKPAMDDIPPVQLRATLDKDRGKPRRGKKLKVDTANPVVAGHVNQIRRINEYVHRQTVIGPKQDRLDIALYRGFNLGDAPGHNYTKGGRVYAAYQSFERADRDHITINGLSTIEVDISACFLTIVHYLLKRPFSGKNDPYAGPSIHRDIVKAWVNLTIGYGQYHTRWPQEAIDRLEEKGHNNVRKTHPIASVKEEVLTNIPIVGEWVESIYTWADLFFIESQIVIRTIERLAFEYNVPCLPIHDAVRVPVKQVVLAKEVLRESFSHYTGLMPIVA
ncbi:hypothetical protein LPN01_07805 [Sphingomonas sp. A2-49]|uniref:hypothetical protein n=1 Tax=Sphingomonas sp. A2-49 TaxID=1391375 RepID=UPI0021D35914|nr:hypothetical protein [Sphingomonas sp. A2-49]MCU6453978.1 hypothetical protein [Sphingomonas sp. A2-49]